MSSSCVVLFLVQVNHQTIVEIGDVFNVFALDVPDKGFLRCLNQEQILLCPQQEMRSLIFVSRSDQSHIYVVVVCESAVLDSAQHITNHERVVFTESLYLSLVAVECSRLSNSATLFFIVVFKDSERIFDAFT